MRAAHEDDEAEDLVASTLERACSIWPRGTASMPAVATISVAIGAEIDDHGEERRLKSGGNVGRVTAEPR